MSHTTDYCVYVSDDLENQIGSGFYTRLSLGRLCFAGGLLHSNQANSWYKTFFYSFALITAFTPSSFLLVVVNAKEELMVNSHFSFISFLSVKRLSTKSKKEW